MAYTDAQLADFLSKCLAANREKDEAAPGASEPILKCAPKMLSAEQMEHIEEVIRQQRIEREKGGWRGAAKWLEENFPEDFKEPTAASGTEVVGNLQNSTMVESLPNSERVARPLTKLEPEEQRETPTIGPQPLANAPESLQGAREAPPAPSLIPLASTFWQALLYGSPDALLSRADANAALRLVAHELSTDCNGADFVGTVRAGALRKALLSRFGAKAWDVKNKLWRAAPLSPGASIPNEDQSQASPGVHDYPRSMPAWRREFCTEVRDEQRLLESLGGWCG